MFETTIQFFLEAKKIQDSVDTWLRENRAVFMVVNK